MTWKLTALSEPIEGQSIIIDRDMVIGRHQQADIVLQASQISRRHAALQLKDQQLWIQDLGSSNGTFVNGEKISEKQLQDQDEICIEPIRFQVSYAAEEETAVLSETAAATEQNDLHKQTPSDDGMPELAERAKDVAINRDGMPTRVDIPKPAPIPEHVDIHAPVVDEAPQQPTPTQDERNEEKTNAKVGLVTLIVIIVLIIIAAIAFLL